MAKSKLRISLLIVSIVSICGVSCRAFQLESYSNPSSFVSSSLYGTWINQRYGGDDHLVINADGTFTQKYTNQDQSYSKEITDVWEIEELGDGRIYLHLLNGHYYVLGSYSGYGDTMYDPISLSGVDVSNRLTLLIQLNQNSEMVLNHLLGSKDDGYIILSEGGAVGFRYLHN